VSAAFGWTHQSGTQKMSDHKVTIDELPSGKWACFFMSLAMKSL
jgi:hypothetical protein